jgi:hypothetical protein
MQVVKGSSMKMRRAERSTLSVKMRRRLGALRRPIFNWEKMAGCDGWPKKKCETPEDCGVKDRLSYETTMTSC